MSQLRVNTIATTAGTQKINVSSMLSTGYYTRQLLVETDTVSRTFSTTLSLAYTGTNKPNFKAGSLVKLFYHMPLRNDSTSWGGAFIYPEISYNNGTTWLGLGDSGYDGNVMQLSSSSIATYENTILINPALDGVSTDFSVTIRFWIRTYDGSVSWNGSHGFGEGGSTGSTSANSLNSNQHYMHYILEEIAKIS